MIKSKEIQFAGELLLLNNRRSIYWPVEQMLIFSDLHLGKSAHFRQNGIAVPREFIQKDLNTLKELILNYDTKVITIVGDFFHAGINSDTELFTQWIQDFPDLQWNIIKGNHDKSVNNNHTELPFQISDSLSIGPITFVHHPEEGQNFTISGHIHPGVKLRASYGKALKIACFLVSENQIILPAFSRFTGLDTGFLKKSDEKYTPYVALDEGVIRV